MVVGCYMKEMLLSGVKGIVKRIWEDIRRYWIAIIVVAVLYTFMHLLFDAFCPSLVITGFPCPGCGITRSVIFFVTGQFERSFFVHPMGGVLVLFGVYCGFFRYIKGRKIPGFKWIIVTLIVAALVLFLVRMILYFPERPPYTYKYGNLMEKIIPNYRKLWH